MRWGFGMVVPEDFTPDPAMTMAVVRRKLFMFSGGSDTFQME